MSDPVEIDIDPISCVTIRRVNTSGESWSNLRGGAGTAVLEYNLAYPVYLQAHTDTDAWQQLNRAGYTFDLAEIDGAITEAAITICNANPMCQFTGRTEGFTEADPEDPEGWEESDYNTFKDTAFTVIEAGSTGSSTTPAWASWELNAAGLTYINKQRGKFASFFKRFGWDINNSPPAWSSGSICRLRMYGMDADAARRPYLTIVCEDEEPDESEKIAASASGESTAAVALQITRCLASSASGTGAAAGAITATAHLTATASGIGTAAGDLTTTSAVQIAASASGEATATADLLRTVPLTATASGTGTAAGDITISGTVALSATASGESTATADLLLTTYLTAAASGEATTSGDLTVRSAIHITATASGIGSATVALLQTHRIQSAASGVGAASGTLRIVVPVDLARLPPLLTISATVLPLTISAAVLDVRIEIMVTKTLTGNTIRFACEFRNWSGDLVDPDAGTGTVTIYDQAGVAVATIPLAPEHKIGTGQYVVLWETPTTEGVYYVEFSGELDTRPAVTRELVRTRWY